jgi:hypothetical protein
VDLTLLNTLSSPVYCSVGHSDGWEIADLAGLTAGMLSGVGDVTDVSELVTFINALKLENSSVSSVNQMIGILQQFCFALAPGQQQQIEQAMQASDLMSPSWWNDLFGGKSLTVFVSDAQNAVTLNSSSIATTDLTVVSKGVREGSGGNLHRWGEPGYYSTMNTSAPPAIVAFGGKYHLFFRDGSGNGILHATSDEGLYWKGATPFYIGFTTSSAPAPVVYNNQLYLFFRDGAGNGILHVVANDGSTFTAPPNWYIGLNCDHQPSVTVYNGVLHVVACDAGGSGVMYACQTATGWQHGYTGENTSAAPAVISFGNRLHVFYKDSGANTGVLHMVSDDGIKYTRASVYHPDFTTSAGPCPLIYRGALLVLFRDATGNGVLYSTSSDGTQFTNPPDWYLGLTLQGEPSAAVLGDRFCIVGRDPAGSGVMTMVPDLS